MVPQLRPYGVVSAVTVCAPSGATEELIHCGTAYFRPAYEVAPFFAAAAVAYAQGRRPDLPVPPGDLAAEAGEAAPLAPPRAPGERRAFKGSAPKDPFARVLLDYWSHAFTPKEWQKRFPFQPATVGYRWTLWYSATNGDLDAAFQSLTADGTVIPEFDFPRQPIAALTAALRPHDQRQLLQSELPHAHVALDPGNVESGWVLFRPEPTPHAPLTVLEFGTTENAALRNKFLALSNDYKLGYLATEMMRPQGMAVAAEAFETCVSNGRFIEAWPGSDWTYVFRPDVKLAICGSARAKDGNVRQGLIDLFGGQDKAIGGKKCPVCKGKGTTGRKKDPCACGTGWLHPPGPLAKMSGDAWAALAVGFYWTLHTPRVHVLSASYKPKPVAGSAPTAPEPQ